MVAGSSTCRFADACRITVDRAARHFQPARVCRWAGYHSVLITLTHIVMLTVLKRSMMPLPPVAHHLPSDLAGIADRPRLRCDDLVSALARVALQVFRQIWAHTHTTITRLAFLHYSLPDPIVRQMLQRLRLYTWEIRIAQWCLSVQR
jgi:hypothetical protein